MKYLRIIPIVFLFVSESEAQVKIIKNIVVERSELRLSDIFQGLKTNQNKVIGDAPLPGKDYILNVNNLRKIANQEELDWIPESANDAVRVLRASQKINRDEIVEIINDKLKDELSFEDYDVALSGNLQDIHIPANEPVNLTLLELKLNSRQTQFTAKLSTGDQLIRISGKINTLIRVPVLIQAKVKGDIIENKDLTWLKLPVSQISSGTILQEESLVGTTPKHLTLKANIPIRKYDLENCVAIKQGQLISVIVKSPLMTLQTQGKAKSSANVGEIISVVNLDSKSILQGKVIGRDLVEVPYTSVSNVKATS